jgi:hypothetical protein
MLIKTVFGLPCSINRVGVVGDKFSVWWNMTLSRQLVSIPVATRSLENIGRVSARVRNWVD